MFTDNPDIKSDSAQELLQNRLDGKNEKRGGISTRNIKTGEVKPVGNKDTYTRILNWMVDPQNADLNARASNEVDFSTGLKDPVYLTYWLGYIGFVEDPGVLQKTIKRLASDPAFVPQAIDAFNIAGLNFADLANTDVTQLPQSQFKEIADKLKILTTTEHRKMPGGHKMMSKV